jgi:hypothetical protein
MIVVFVCCCKCVLLQMSNIHLFVHASLPAAHALVLAVPCMVLQAELEAAEQSGSSLVPVDLPEGGELLVPLGEEVVPHPSGDGRTYTIKWAQDDEGRLVVLDCQLAQGTVSSASTAATPAAMEAGSADLIASSCSNAACTNSKAQKQL